MKNLDNVNFYTHCKKDEGTPSETGKSVKWIVCQCGLAITSFLDVFSMAALACWPVMRFDPPCWMILT